MAWLCAAGIAHRKHLLVETTVIAAAHAVVIVVMGTGNKLWRAGSTAGKLKVGPLQSAGDGVAVKKSSAACRIAASRLIAVVVTQ